MIIIKKIKPEPFKITKNWVDQSERLKGTFPELTDADLRCESGKEEDLLRRVGARLNKKREEVVNIVKNNQPVGKK